MPSSACLQWQISVLSWARHYLFTMNLFRGTSSVCTQSAVNLCAHTPVLSIFYLRVLEGFKNSNLSKIIFEKLLAPVVQIYGLLAAIKWICTLPVFCGVKECWKMCNFAHCLKKYFWVSVQHSGPWLHLMTKKAIRAEVTENHRAFFLQSSHLLCLEWLDLVLIIPNSPWHFSKWDHQGP